MFNAALDWLCTQGVQVERYNPTHQYEAFARNASVVKAVNDHGLGCLPLILLNGKIVSHKSYPNREEPPVLVGLSGAATTVPQ